VKALLPAVVLAPFLAAALVRWWRARTAVRSRERWILWIPIGGSVVVGFRSELGLARRARILVEALAAAYLAAAAIALVIGLAAGFRGDASRYVITGVVPGAAADGILQPGDQLRALDGAPLDPDDTPLVRRVADSGGRPMRFELIRDGRTVTATVTPHPSGPTGDLRLGVELALVDVREHPGAAATLGRALLLPGRHAARVLDAMKDNALGPPDDSARFLGPVGIVDMMSRLESTAEAFDIAVLVSIYLLVLAELADLAILIGIAVVALRRRAR
jgi:hypothetical protein